MDKVIIALLLGGCAALTAYALKISTPIRKDAGALLTEQAPPPPAATKAASAPVALAQNEHDALHAAPVTELSTGDAVNHGVFDSVPQESAGPNETPAVAAFRQANERMHSGMNIEFTGAPDADFVSGMIPHHQGAIDMAKIVLEHGKDPEIRKMAEGIIAAQEAEIKRMREWLAKNQPAPKPAP
jgi:hypothetical protein